MKKNMLFQLMIFCITLSTADTALGTTLNANNGQFSFINKTDKMITGVIVSSSKGIVSNIAITCSPKCSINIAEDRTTENLSFSFLGQDNKIITGYIWSPGSEHSEIVIDYNSLGYYIFERAKVSYQMDPSILYQKLSRYFSSNDQPNPNIFSALSEQYRNNPGTNSDFYINLKKNLDQIIIAPAATSNIRAMARTTNSLSSITSPAGSQTGATTVTPEAVSSTTTSQRTCDSTYFITTLNVLSSASYIIQPALVGAAIATAFYGTSQAFGLECASDTQNLRASIDSLQSQMDIVNQTMTNFGQTFADMKSSAAKDKMDSILNKFNSDINLYEAIAYVHYDAVFSSGIKKDQNGQTVTYTKLKDFNKNNGGIRKLIEDSGNMPYKELFNKRFEILKLFNVLIADTSVEDLQKTFKAAYSDSQKITGNIIMERNLANLAVIKTAAKVILTAEETELILSEIIKSVTSALDKHEIDDAWVTKNLGAFTVDRIGSPENPNLIIKQEVPWREALTYVQNLAQNKIKHIGTLLPTSTGSTNLLINPLDGFPTQLEQNLIAHGCADSNNKVSIDKWYTNGTEGVDPYIVPICHGGGYSDGTPINDKTYKSVYYYKKASGNFTNVFGAIVPLNTQGEYAYKDLANLVTVNKTALREGDNTTSYLFYLTSSKPLMLYSNKLTSVPSILQAAQYFVTKYVNLIAYNFADPSNPVTSPNQSVILGPIKKSNGLYNFWSAMNIPFNWFCDGTHPTKEVRPLVSERVFLAFELDGYTYPFSLIIGAFGDSYHSGMFCNDYSAKNPMKTEKPQNLRLQCIADQCSNNGSSIVWNTPNGKVNVSLQSKGLGEVQLQVDKSDK